MKTFRQILEQTTDDSCRFTAGVSMAAPPGGTTKLSSLMHLDKKRYKWFARNGMKKITANKKIEEQIVCNSEPGMQQHLPNNRMPEYVPKSNSNQICPRCNRKRVKLVQNETGKIERYCERCKCKV